MGLRFRPRHVQQSLLDHLAVRLDALGWVTPPVNFGVVPLTFIDHEPDFETHEDIAPNTVAVSLLSEFEDRTVELGGGLWKVSYTFAVDVFGVSPPTAVSIASDVKDVLVDQPWVQLKDYANDPPTVSDEHIEIDNVTVARPRITRGAHAYKLRWRSVQGRAVAFFQR